jgi:phage terminase large subunit-like protein
MTRGERVIAFIERFLKVPEGAHVGQPIVLCEFQRRFILDVYDNPHGTTTAYLSVARKNGKTALIAGILLAHLVGPEAVQNSQIVSGAMSRDQAALVFALACKMIQLNPELAELVHIIPSGKKLLGKPMNVEFRALAAEGKTAHGLSPVLAILDEVGQVRGPQSDFVDAITTAQGAHSAPLLIAISTQAATDNDLFSIWLDDARRSDDRHIVCHVYEADKDARLDDPEQWAKANPAIGLFRSVDDMSRQSERAMRMPTSEATFRNLCLNQRVSVTNPFVSRSVWESCGAVPESLDGCEVYGGLDLSARTDLTAFVLAGRTPSGEWEVMPFFWTPEVGIYDRAKRDRVPYDVWAAQGLIRTTPGATVDYEYVIAEIAEITADLDLRMIGFDRWRMDVFKRDMERLGVELPLIEFGQGYKDMAPALDTLEAALLNGRLRHGGHPVLAMCAANAVVTTDPAGGRKLDKHKATGRIDGMVALAMALGVASKHGEEPMDFDFLMNPLVLG